MPGKECYHCKQLVTDPKTHDCWTTTEEKLTADLDDDLRDAWERLRETASDFGEQRIYASHNSIMFSRTHCYFFVRPRASFLEVWIFLGRTVKHPHIRRSMANSRKVCHLVQVRHRDEVEAPLTDWLREAYEVTETLRSRPATKKKPAVRKKSPARKNPAAQKRRLGPKKKAARRKLAARH